MSHSITNTFTTNTNWKKIAAPLFLTAGLAFGLVGCQSDADQASDNISTAADNFEIDRRIVFYNTITDTYMFTVEGKCSIEKNPQKQQLAVTCKIGEGKNDLYKHYLGQSDNVAYLVQQLEGANVSRYHHRIIFKPQSILPDIDFRGDTEEMKKALTPD